MDSEEENKGVINKTHLILIMPDMGMRSKSSHPKNAGIILSALSSIKSRVAKINILLKRKR